MNTKSWLPLFLVTSAILGSGCGMFNDMGSRLGAGLNEQTDSIGQNLVSGISSGLADSINQEKVKKLVNRLVTEMAASLDSNLATIEVDTLVDKFFLSLKDNLSDPAFRDSLSALVSSLLATAGEAGNQEVSKIVDSLFLQLDSEASSRLIGRLREELIGTETSEALQRLLQESIANALTDSSAAIIRDRLLGPRTNEAIRAIVDSAMTTIVNRMNNDLNPSLQSNISFIQKNARELLIIVGVIALGIIGFVWYQRRKYIRISSLMSAQIFEMPNQQSYDELTLRIKQTAVETGLEPTLRKILEENGLLGQEAWDNYLKKKNVEGGSQASRPVDQ